VEICVLVHQQHLRLRIRIFYESLESFCFFNFCDFSEITLIFHLVVFLDSEILELRVIIKIASACVSILRFAPILLFNKLTL